MTAIGVPPGHNGERVWTGETDSFLTRFQKIRPNRHPYTYAPVRKLIGNALRNRRSQLKGKRIQGLEYADIGCGWNSHPDLINLDFEWNPQIDVCWNITTGLPFADGSLKGIFSEHCLEHFPLPVAAAILKDCHRALAKGGRIRIIVPDAAIYVDLYTRARAGEAVTFPYESVHRYEDIADPMLHLNRVFYQDRHSPFGHRFMYDASMMAKLLTHAGFVNVESTSFRAGKVATLLVDTPERQIESLYIEADAG